MIFLFFLSIWSSSFFSSRLFYIFSILYFFLPLKLVVPDPPLFFPILFSYYMILFFFSPILSVLYVILFIFFIAAIEMVPSVPLRYTVGTTRASHSFWKFMDVTPRVSSIFYMVISSWCENTHYCILILKKMIHYDCESIRLVEYQKSLSHDVIIFITF